MAPYAPIVLNTSALDPTFSGDGRLTTGFGGLGDDERARAVLALEVGRFIVAGWAADMAGTQSDFALAMYLEDGRLDTSFSEDGKLTVDISGFDRAQAMALQADGKLLIVGSSDGNPDGTGTNISMVRLDLSGALDPNFGDGGQLIISLATSAEAEEVATAVAIQPDGSILIGGSSDYEYVLMRRLSDGSADTSFGGGDGVVQGLFSIDGGSSVKAMTRLEDGRILVAGQVYSAETGDDFAIACHLPNGSLDPSFGTAGIWRMHLGDHDQIRSIAIQQDGAIVLAGVTGSVIEGVIQDTDGVVIRLTPDGQLDPSFVNGIGFLTLDVSDNDSFSSVMVQADGRIIASGGNSREFGEAWLVAIDTDGSIAADGSSTLSVTYGEGTSAVHASAFAANGQLIAVGGSFGGDTEMGDYDFGVLRLASGFSPPHGMAGQYFSYTLPQTLFLDPDTEALSFSIQLANGDPLPSWLRFDAASQTLKGTPGDADSGVLPLKISASDGLSTTSFHAQLRIDTAFTRSLLYPDDARWNAEQPLGTAGTVLSYSFMEQTPDYAEGAELETFLPLDGNYRDAVRTVLEMYQRIAGIEFIEVDEATSSSAGWATIRFGSYYEPESTTAAYAYTPGGHESAGDVWINRKGDDEWRDPAPGTYDYGVLIHELGHALGLKHPGPYGPDDTGPYLDIDFKLEDTEHQTVMSYHQRQDIWFPDGTGKSLLISPRTPMRYDVAAIQFLYGENAQATASDDHYVFDPTEPLIENIWDGGGHDALDASNWPRAVAIDLTPGAFSSLYFAATKPSDDFRYWGYENVSISFNTWIEDVRGGLGDDTLRGNALSNTLQGGPGDDFLDGGPGEDRAVFSGSRSLFEVEQTPDGRWRVTDTRTSGDEGSDLLADIEALVFDDLTLPLPDTSPLAGQIYHWRSHALISDVQVEARATSSSALGEYLTESNAQGGFDLGYIPLESYALALERTLDSSEVSQAINSADAMAALKLALGRNPNPDPDGPGPLQPAPVSPYQRIAADMDGDGMLTREDAMEILRIVQGQGLSMTPEWVFIPELAKLSGMTGASAALPGLTLVIDDATERQNFVAVLRGDVDGNWAAPASSVFLPIGELEALMAAHADIIQPGQFGLPAAGIL